MTSWGDINQVLNRLMSAGIIVRFWTNLGEQRTPLGLHVIVTPPAPVDDAAADALRQRVAGDLRTLSDLVTVTVDRSGR